jgi:CDP-glycerol glycerophosphotransferase (TagB/SpsB family)
MYNNLNFKDNFPVIYGPTYINGDFLEKYLDIFLKLKAVISGAKIFSINNLFYNIEYITYICLGHGISYLKEFLFKDYYSQKLYNKIFLPDSNLLISSAIKYGWDNNNIIKIGLPRWDIFINYEKNSPNNYTKNNSIFVMFTWRDIKKFNKISKYYFKNILNLINNRNIIKNLKLKGISLYFSLHHNIEEYKYMFHQNNYIKYIIQEKINECLKKVSLIVTDFSSIIFDIIVRYKPYVLYIPDSDDSNIKKIYSKEYYDIINGLKNGSIIFENKFFNLNETIRKIIFYIKNNFKLESNLEQFYQTFKLEGGNNTIKIINYLKDL